MTALGSATDALRDARRALDDAFTATAGAWRDEQRDEIEAQAMVPLARLTADAARTLDTAATNVAAALRRLGLR